MPISNLVSWVALGFAVGYATTLLPSKLGGVSVPLKLGLGSAGGLAAGYLGWSLRAYHSRYAPLGFVFAIAGAVGVLAVYYWLFVRPTVGPFHRVDQ